MYSNASSEGMVCLLPMRTARIVSLASRLALRFVMSLTYRRLVRSFYPESGTELLVCKVCAPVAPVTPRLLALDHTAHQVGDVGMALDAAALLGCEARVGVALVGGGGGADALGPQPPG